MRLRTSTSWGIAGVAFTWTLMLIFVSVILFLRAPNVLSAVELADQEIKPVTTILVTLAQHRGRDDAETQNTIARALDQLASHDDMQAPLASQDLVVREGRRWLTDRTLHNSDAFRAAAVQLSLDARQRIDAIHAPLYKVYITVALAVIALGMSLFFIRFLMARLVDPLEEVFHYLQSPSPTGILPPFEPMNGVSEVEIIQESLHAMITAKRAYIQARHEHVPFGDQSAVEALLERVDGPVWVMDRRGALLGANDAAIDVLAGENGQEVRDELYDLIPCFAANFDNAETDTMNIPVCWDLKLAKDGEAMVCIRRDGPVGEC